MMVLRRLRAEGVRLVTPELVEGTKPRPSEHELTSLVEPVPRSISLGVFRDALERLIQSTREFDSGMDADAAVAIHQALGLTRREAADAGIWRYLAIVESPEFVRHRYENNSWTSMRRRFWSVGTRPDSNTLSRLWWIAELTRENEDFTLTRRVLGRQTLATGIFVRSLSGYRPAVEAIVEVLETEHQGVIEAVLLQFTRMLGTVPLESLDRTAIESRLQALRAVCQEPRQGQTDRGDESHRAG